VHPQVVKLKGIALDFLFPRWCIGCGKEGEFLCSSCRQQLPRITPPVCPRCGRPQSSGILCPNCVTWQAEIDGIRSHELKYRNLRALAVTLARLLHDYLVASPVPGEVLVPVPLHHKRLRERGYNQSSLLAHELGKLTNLPVVDDCLIRQRHMPPQARTSSVDERRSNVAGAFACRDRRLRDKQVLLVDDVSTSGATLNACAEALKAGGASAVWGLVLAREI